jgi:hypothetical protein
MGNNSESTGGYMDLPDKKFPNEVDRDHYYGREAVNFILSHPLAYAKLSVRRAITTYGRETIGVVWNEKGLGSKYKDTSLVTLKRLSSAYWWILLVLGLAGIVLVLRRRLIKPLWPLLAAVFYFAAFPILTVAMDRYHVPVDPMLAIFAAYALLWRSPEVQHSESGPRPATGEEHGSSNRGSGVRYTQAARHDGRQKILGQLAHPPLHDKSELAVVTLAENGGMIPGDFVGWAAIAEIVECKRLASHSLETLQRIWMAVVSEVSRSENHHPVEYRQYLGLALGHAAIPKFQMSAVFLAPVFVQIQDQVQAPIQAIFGMFVEVGMNTELPSPHDLVKSASVETGVGNEILDSRHAAQEFEECHGVQMIEEQPSNRAEGCLFGRRQLDLARVIELLPANLIWLWEFRKHRVEHVGIQEIVKHDMTKWLRIDVRAVRGRHHLFHPLDRQERVQRQFLYQRFHSLLSNPPKDPSPITAHSL